MPSEHIAGLAIILAAGIAAQWLAWRLHLPSILLLLLSGMLAGPVTGLLNPDRLFGDLLLPLISISVALVLFEGGLSLRLADLREIGSIVRNLVTIGALITWAIAAAVAHLVLELELPIAVLLGSILIVTGPTVIGPLLTHVRPVGRVGSIAKWEGILIDPIGAILAVLTFEVIVAVGFRHGASHFLLGMLAFLLSGLLIGLAATAVLILFLRRNWIPDFLQNGVSLMAVVLVHTAANSFREESGLLAVTIMGIALASQKYYPVRHILEFKENLRVLLVGGLFVLLAARLDLRDLQAFDGRSLIFLASLMFVARPAAVAASTLGSELNLRERCFLACLAPRGIVAAAISALFASRLSAAGYPDARQLVSETFLVIIGTVAVYGLTAFPLARKLGLADAKPQGILVVGAHTWARHLAAAIRAENFEVVLVDSNWSSISAARLEGYRTYFGGVLSEHVLDEIDLYGIGRLLALTSNDEANALAALHFSDVFGRAGVYQLSPEDLEANRRKLVAPLELRGRFLFGSKVTYSYFSDQFARGATIKGTKFTEKFGYDDFRENYGDETIPLFLITPSRELLVYTIESQPKPADGCSLISLVPPPRDAAGT